MNTLFSNCDNEREQLQMCLPLQYEAEKQEGKPRLPKESPNLLIKEMTPKPVPKKPRQYKPCERLLKQLKKDTKKGLYLN